MAKQALVRTPFPTMAEVANTLGLTKGEVAELEQLAEEILHGDGYRGGTPPASRLRQVYKRNRHAPGRVVAAPSR
jgi:hypothetical protein